MRKFSPGFNGIATEFKYCRSHEEHRWLQHTLQDIFYRPKRMGKPGYDLIQGQILYDAIAGEMYDTHSEV